MPAELAAARFKDEVMRRWSGYTLDTLRDADAHELFLTWELVTNEKLGEAEEAD